jgi:hypothetical protein
MSLNINEIIEWYNSGIYTDTINTNWCENRSAFNGRLSSYLNQLKDSFNDECLYLFISSLGEVGNNCFDHNVGFWQDKAGCLFVREKKFAIIADRGQGIRSSLSRVIDFKKEKLKPIELAYNRVVTGRAPEKRGNGLKFVKKSIANCNINLFVLSDSEEFYLSKKIQNEDLDKIKTCSNSGVFNYFYWGTLL